MAVSGLRDHLGLGVSRVGAAGLTLVFCEVKCRSGLGFGHPLEASKAERAFREIARLSRGAYAPFDAGSAKQLRELLTAVAVYAAGGRKALKDYSEETKSGGALRLLEQLG